LPLITPEPVVSVCLPMVWGCCSPATDTG
jgi:hypothetical protein